MIQGSPEWFAARLGKVTASRVADVIARTKSGWGASRANYMAELLVERLTGQSAPSYENDAMRWGKEKEPEARVAYEFTNGLPVAQVGFIDHPTIPMSGASPDGVINNGLVEIKCANTATHIETLLSGTVPAKYETQMQWQMACAGADWCDFVSYDPRVPEPMQLFVKRLERDEKIIKQLEKDVAEFLGELDGKLAVLRERYKLEEAA